MTTPSLRPGLGCIPYSTGATFRVWAPNAPWVRVAGSFNGWSATADELASEGNGYWSADIESVNVGDEYRYVIGSVRHWRVDPRARDVTSSVGNGVVTSSHYPWQANDYQLRPWNEWVIYEMHVASFPDDPVANEKMFEAVARELPYLQELGINAIELMPAHEFPSDNSWGYNPAHAFAVEHSYGSPAALKSLIDEAHRLNMAVILDVVYQHLGSRDLEHSTWQFDGWFDTWSGREMGGIYFYNDWRANTDVGSRPDYGRPEVREFIRDNVMMWLEEYRFDGLRLDKVVGIRNAHGIDQVAPDDPSNLGGWGWNLLKWINDEVNRSQPWKLVIAEDMRQNPRITQATSSGGAGFDCQWDDQFHHTLRRAMVATHDHERDVDGVANAIQRKFNEDAFQRVIYTESHDEVGNFEGNPNGKKRVPEDICPGHADHWVAKKRSTLGAAAVFTSPGIPMIFQGQEMLEWAQFTGSNRMDWGKVNRYSGIVNLYRDLIRLRRNWHNNTRGLRGHHVRTYHINKSDQLLAYWRWQDGGPGDDVVVVLNFRNIPYSDYVIGFPRPGWWHVRFNSDWSGYSPDFGNHPSHSVHANSGERDRLAYHASIGIGPYTALIFSQ